MSKAWETTREPGLSWLKRFGRNFIFTSGNRYMVTTDAADRSTVRMSCWRISAESFTPALSIFARYSLTRSPSISNPTAPAPFFAAVITILPSPEPRS